MPHTRTLLDWIGTLTVTQGRLSGQPFVVLPWQRRFLRGAFRAGVPRCAFVLRGQGYKDGAEDVRAFRTANRSHGVCRGG